MEHRMLNCYSWTLSLPFWYGGNVLSISSIWSNYRECSSLVKPLDGSFLRESELEIIKKRGLESRLQLISRRSPDRLRAGDIIRVKRKFMESSNRILQFTGICMAINRRGLGSSLIVRSVIDRVGVEQTFPVFSPLITQMDIVKRGRFRKAKLYFLRRKSGKRLPYTTS
jgi:large subunit ribosomal protein L19